jgi:sterol desaturase/sphingolipid hydroxylase (fatty acid hydroxylase superfamily)
MLDTIINAWLELGLWLMGLAVVFSALSRITPCNPDQPMLRKDLLTDIAYSFIVPILGRFVRLLYIGFGVYLFFRSVAPTTLEDYMVHGFGPLAQMPIWLQAAIIFLVSDFLLYWTHRWFHMQNMWPFHAIHHSPQHVDWLSTYRFHPVNVWLSFTLVDSIMLLIGFSPAAVGLMAGFNTAYSAMVHANLNWTFGPFRYVFASPVFHRWHHTAQIEGMDKNFAPTFPLLDIVFGTFYMPEACVPEHYGVSGSDIPHGFASQMIWPFKEIARQRKKN